MLQQSKELPKQYILKESLKDQPLPYLRNRSKGKNIRYMDKRKSQHKKKFNKSKEEI